MASSSRRRDAIQRLVRVVEGAGFSLIKEKGSVRHYAKAGVPRVIRIDYHGAKEVPSGTCHAVLKAAGLKVEKTK